MKFKMHGAHKQTQKNRSSEKFPTHSKFYIRKLYEIQINAICG